MKLIVGLGNPGDIYQDSRHNIGFSVVRALAKAQRITLKKERGVLALSGKGKAGDQEALLAMPLTFMNLSGQAVSALMRKYKLELSELLVVSDDLDLELGRIRLRAYGSSGGQRGLRSIIEALKSNNFARLRVGIGRPPHHKDIDAAEYVLSGFNKKEKSAVKEIIIEALRCCETWAQAGVTEAMNIFNKPREKNE